MSKAAFHQAQSQQTKSAASSIFDCTTKVLQTRQVKAARFQACGAQHLLQPEQLVLEGCGDLGLHHGMTGTFAAAGPATRIFLLVEFSLQQPPTLA